MIKILIVTLLVALALSRSYPMFKQCDPRWGGEQLGTSSGTICSAGSLVSSVAMSLAGTGLSSDPLSLNAYLKAIAGGYINGDTLNWFAINPMGLTFEDKIQNNQIKHYLDLGKVIFCNVRNGKHWVLAYGWTDDSILVNDPNYDLQSYQLS